MSSLFYGLEIAKSGLFASQKGLTLVGHNVANVDTPGYSRQRLSVTAVDSNMLGTMLASPTKGAVGGGVAVKFVEQLRNSYADREYRNENAALELWSTRTEEMGFIEDLLNEQSNNSISKTLADFFASVNELSKDPDPSNAEKRTNMRQAALKLTDTFNHYGRQLEELRSTYNGSMKTTVDQINDILSGIAEYNKQIFTYELGGEPANDLRDQRNLLLDELSGLVDITYSEDNMGRLSVAVQGVDLVSHTTVNGLEAVANADGDYEIFYEGTTTPFEYTSGKLEAYRILRDGNTESEIGIPRILATLNQLAQSIAEEFNAIHSTGYTLPHDGTASQTGINFFDVPAGGYGDITARDFTLSNEILDSIYNIAASSEPVDPSAPGSSQTGNNIRALELVALSTSVSVPVVGSFEGYLSNIVVEIAVESSHCQKMASSQESVMQNLENRRMSASGVSIDEEMVQMMKYQHAYSAASRLITALDEALDVLINKTGMVGR